MIMSESAVSFMVPEEIDEELNNILYVDDELSNLRVFESIFCRYYNVFTASSGSMGIKLLAKYDIHMIITDQKMPEMTGTDLLEKTLEDHPDIIRIILTGFADIQAIIKAINKCSIYKYITKPYENTEMKEIIDKGLEIYNMRMRKYKHQEKSPSPTAITEIQPVKKPNKELVLAAVNDATLNKTYLDQFFDHTVLYTMPKVDEFRAIYMDMNMIHDGESSLLYCFLIKGSTTIDFSVAFLHLKDKFRRTIETEFEGLTLSSLLDALEAFYSENNFDLGPFEYALMSYHYASGQLDFLAKEEKIKIYEVNEQLSSKRMTIKKTDIGGYNHYTLQSKSPLMVYLYDFKLKQNAKESDFLHNLHQIISNSSNSPFELQNTQIGAGIKSISSDLEDIGLLGLHLAE